MNQIVCIKQVPAIAELAVDAGNNSLIREGYPARINPADLRALELALTLRDRCGGKVTAMSMGPLGARDALITALEMGVDDAVLLSDKRFSGADVYATGCTLAMGCRALGAFDLAICGRQSSDGDTGQVGPSLAQQLGWPHVYNVVSVENCSKYEMQISQQLDQMRVSLKLPFPCVLICAQNAFAPRLPTLKGKLEAKRKSIRILALEDLDDDDANLYGLRGSPTRVEKIYSVTLPPPQAPISGDADFLASEVMNALNGLRPPVANFLKKLDQKL